jgi:hypothetical protein
MGRINSFIEETLVAAFFCAPTELPPKILEPVRSQFGVLDRVLDIAMPKVRLQIARVMAGIGEGEAAGVAQQNSGKKSPLESGLSHALLKERRSDACAEHIARLGRIAM